MYLPKTFVHGECINDVVMNKVVRDKIYFGCNVPKVAYTRASDGSNLKKVHLKIRKSVEIIASGAD